MNPEALEQKYRDLASNFLTLLFQDLQRNDIRIDPAWEIDHLCYRVESDFEYAEVKREFEQFGRCIGESLVGGRLIATYNLRNPIRFRHWQIPLIEIPAPKAGKPTPTGFEHAEVVTPLALGELQKQYAHLKLDLGGLNKSLNPELEIVLGPRNLKFHPLSLAEVIRLENQLAN